jgi:hypothetical protein
MPLAVKKRRLSIAMEETIDGENVRSRKLVKKEEDVVDALNW